MGGKSGYIPSPTLSKILIMLNGWVAERLKALVLKTGRPQGLVGSNPTPSASRLNGLI